MRTSHVSFRAIGFYVITLSMMVLLFGLSIRLGTYTLSFEEIWAAFQPDDKNYFTLMEYRQCGRVSCCFGIDVLTKLSILLDANFCLFRRRTLFCHFMDRVRF